ncbi:MAG: hypothetical protein GY715_05820 [Planctomycetes bacterium]|nr:hypothetical protein [Planctomycetota bacterium]
MSGGFLVPEHLDQFIELAVAGILPTPIDRRRSPVPYSHSHYLEFIATAAEPDAPMNPLCEFADFIYHYGHLMFEGSTETIDPDLWERMRAFCDEEIAPDE